MNNHNDQKYDGSRQASRLKRKDDEIFKHWGATEVYRATTGKAANPSEVSPTAIYMVRLEDGWHYAEASWIGASCGAEAFEQPTGELAWLAYELVSAQKAVETYNRKSS